MKHIKRAAMLLCAAVLFVGCGYQGKETPGEKKTFTGAIEIVLSDQGITVDGSAISEDPESAVYAANDIVFYLEGQGFTYGEGTAEDAHSQKEADGHTVVHITKPGAYAVSGSLSAGQIAVDLGKNAEEDPEAVVTLILNGLDIQCTVAPAVIFYNVYECGDTDAETAVKDVDTAGAGANVLIADDTINHVKGSYVARIYKSYELNAAGTEVIDSKKLHKYDAAFYSKKSMNINGDEKGTGVLNITAENEGLDSELHLTINGGNINIVSGNDGINTNEDEVSVTTVNGGVLNIRVSGETGEGDGIDSNGWLVINGGTIIAQACGFSADAGIDSDMGIHLNGGTVIATGNMLDRISESDSNFAVFSFASRQEGGTACKMKNAKGDVVFEHTPENDFVYLLVSAEDLTAGTYTLWSGEVQLAAGAESAMGGFGGMMGGRPGDFEDMMGGMSDGLEGGGRGDTKIPEGMEPPKGMARPEDMEPPKGMARPEGVEPPKGMARPEGMERPEGAGNFFGREGAAELSTDIVIVDGGNYFRNVSEAGE